MALKYAPGAEFSDDSPLSLTVFFGALGDGISIVIEHSLSRVMPAAAVEALDGFRDELLRSSELLREVTNPHFSGDRDELLRSFLALQTCWGLVAQAIAGSMSRFIEAQIPEALELRRAAEQPKR